MTVLQTDMTLSKKYFHGYFEIELLFKLYARSGIYGDAHFHFNFHHFLGNIFSGKACKKQN